MAIRKALHGVGNTSAFHKDGKLIRHRPTKILSDSGKHISRTEHAKILKSVKKTQGRKMARFTAQTSRFANNYGIRNR